MGGRQVGAHGHDLVVVIFSQKGPDGPGNEHASHSGFALTEHDDVDFIAIGLSQCLWDPSIVKR